MRRPDKIAAIGGLDKDPRLWSSSMLQHEINDDLLYGSVRELATQIRMQRLSPVALTEAYLDRLEKIGLKLGAVVMVIRESALKEARAAEQEIRAGNYRGPLHGIPNGAKDLLATMGIPTKGDKVTR
jgi:aspartyl-tRNA(Asn)/glutamyl-tRNA(Gln) amidotransferase subunit A